MESLPSALTWWVSAVEASIVAALFWLVLGMRREMDARVDHKDLRQSDGLTRTREDLSEFKLEVARTYVPLTLIRDVDRRIGEQLLRIEEKLEDMRRDNSEARR